MTSNTENNSFKKLREEETENYQEPPLKLKKDVEGNLSLVKFVGQIFELYLPRVVGVFISLAGGSNKKETESADDNIFVDSDDSTTGSAKTDSFTPGKDEMD